MIRSAANRYWQQLRAEARAFPWRNALPRMAADFLFVNVSMVLAFVLWFMFHTLIRQVRHTGLLAENFRGFVQNYWLWWSLLALLVFHLSGFYTRTRGYVSRYKAWIIFRAVSLCVVLIVFTDYFLFRGDLIPRGVAALSWVLLLATVGGSRFVKEVFLRHYHVQAKRPPLRADRVLVVGGAGYLGCVLVQHLLACGYKVRVLDSLLYGEQALKSAEHNSNFELVVGDIRDIQAMVQAMKGCDAVVDLAAIVGDPACEENRPLAVEVNRAATLMAIEIARGHGIGRFLFASTCSVYGAADSILDEHSATAPLSTYARTKVDSEKLVLAAKTPNFHSTVLRLGTLFGLSPRMRFDLVVNLLVRRAAHEGKITIFNGDQWRPFIHVKDAARALVICLEGSSDVVSGEVFNVGDNALNHRLAEIGEMIRRVAPAAHIEHVENSDARNYRVSFDKIRSCLGFTCRITVAEGIREIYEAIQLGGIGDVTDTRFSNLTMAKALKHAAAADRSSFRLLEELMRYE